ncbi:MAG: ATP-binding domain-containing protein, partial [Nitrospinae bacterium]|nr:ATP-binding domain-containing protein [Nitrospinota bacterium]
EGEAEDPEMLTLTTIHQAKGLEWDVVFMIGLADGKFPHERNLEPIEKLEEERRLFYVAATRCRKHLEISVPLTIQTGGRTQIFRPSRFVEELPGEVVRVELPEGSEHLQPYLGLGAGASSYVDGVLTKNWNLPSRYIREVNSRGRAVEFAEKLEPGQALGETLMLGLRLLEKGVSMDQLEKRFRISFREVYGKVLSALSGKNLISIDQDRITLTRKGLFLADSVILEFIS